MARRKQEEEHENHERWLVSYADFITLLFAFFVVMYAISSVNEGKYRVLSSAILDAFRTGSTMNLQTVPPSGGANTMVEVPHAKPIARSVKSEMQVRENQKLGALASDLQKLMDPLVKGGQVKITQSDKGVVIEIRDTALFPVGQAIPAPQSQRVLAQMAQILARVDNSVSVEGFTDNIPISNPVFPSNWELSAARAGSVVRLFVENGIDPSRLVAVGRASNQPVAANDSAEGRARNRRVSITVSSKTHEEAQALPIEALQEAQHPASASAAGTP
ncbi:MULTISPECIES: flagellar motor protein MotD [Gulbenkiania]|uniref:Flagellar motor protein MotB n=2 Tax=Gulbenkiania TaxID=397456 RepID=A0A0K6GTY0_9NEIS|nr:MULTISPECIES: flagellar motor protein MotD [Gulbenkiania]TCW33810.1 chemotaxis protein MotB [Gulbenkiania mobilis]CUA82181.1 Flagellar motor protein MotB [Gulbenkiania indica]